MLPSESFVRFLEPLCSPEQAADILNQVRAAGDRAGLKPVVAKLAEINPKPAWHLVLIEPDQTCRLETLGVGECRIGRHPGEGGIKIVDVFASRLHCEVTVEESDRLSVSDLGSRRGTKVNDTPLPVGESRSLSRQDSIIFCNTIIEIMRM
jgi:hypothetical protein